MVNKQRKIYQDSFFIVAIFYSKQSNHSLILLFNAIQQKIIHTFAQSPSQLIILLAASNISSKAVRVVYRQ